MDQARFCPCFLLASAACRVNNSTQHITQVEVQKEGLALQEGVQKEGAALQPDSAKPDKLPPKDKVKSERQASLQKSKQVKTARNLQSKKDKEQRQKQKEKEKEGTTVSCQSVCISLGASQSTQNPTVLETVRNRPALACCALSCQSLPCVLTAQPVWAA